MAGFMRHVINNYNKVLLNIDDPAVKSWLFMESPSPMLCIVGAYLMFVLKVGPKMMEKRPAFQLNTVMILYNAFQVLFSIWVAYLMFDVEVIRLFSFRTCNFHSPSDAQTYRVLLGSAWWYFFAKIVEFLDTVFFVLRKKQNQVTFLHVYHHTITALFSWWFLISFCNEIKNLGILIGFLNSFVHIIMYTYYFIAALGPKYKKYLWWKKYITWIQLLQFGIVLFYLIITLTSDCRTPKVLTIFFITHTTILIYLFSDFYRKAYKRKMI